MHSVIEVVSGFVGNPDVVRMFLDIMLKSLVVLVLAGAICLAWRRASSATRHLIWLFSLLGVLLLPVVSAVMPSWHKPLWAVSTSLISGNRYALTLDLVPVEPAGAAVRPFESAVQRADGAAMEPNDINRAGRFMTAFNATWLVAASTVWIAGTLLTLLSVIIGHVGLRRLAHRARRLHDAEWVRVLRESCDRLNIRRPVTLLKSCLKTMPLTWGWWRPVVLLPADSDSWSVERRQMVLSHELAHIKRRDCLTQGIARLVCGLWWFNPLVWVAAREMRVERERACDDLVLASGWKASDYADHLVEIARSSPWTPQLNAIAMARPGGLQQRVLAILDGRRNRKRVSASAAAVVALVFLATAMTLGGWAQAVSARSPASWSVKNSKVADQLKHFVAEKQAQATAALKSEGQEVLPEYSAMFEAAAKGDWLSIRNIWNDLRERAPQYEGDGPKDKRLHGTAWQAMLEIWGGFGNIAGDENNVVSLGEDIIASIPPGSIYFGGTDPGRCVITALQKSQVNAEPFFTLTQNALADRTYLQYLREMYGKKIRLPTDEDSQQCFQEYVADAGRRLKENKLKPGEDVRLVDGRVQVGGQVSVMAINGLLTKLIFDENPDHEFYVEESFPLDWMYPRLSPNGPIMKINRQPPAQLSDEVVQRDREYWTRAVKPMIGDWLEYDTPVQRVVAFAGKESLPATQGDRRDPQADSGTKWAAKLRSSIAGLYVWRVQHASDEAERTRMRREADFAFRQAFALCPYSPEAVFRYVNFLMMQGRVADALLVAETAGQVDQQNDQIRQLVEHLQQLQKAKK